VRLAPAPPHTTASQLTMIRCTKRRSDACSGAHLNPAVSLVSFLIFPDRLSLLGTLAYMACQTAGAFVGAFLGWLITNSTSAPVIDQFGRAFVAELGFTSLLLVTALTAFAGHVRCSASTTRTIWLTLTHAPAL